MPRVCNFPEGIFPTILTTHRHAVAVDKSRSLVPVAAMFEQIDHMAPEIEAWNKTQPPERQMTDEKLKSGITGSNPVMELFKLREGKIAEVDAIF